MFNWLTTIGGLCLLAALVAFYIAVVPTLDSGFVVEITRRDCMVVEGVTHGGQRIRETIYVR